MNTYNLGYLLQIELKDAQDAQAAVGRAIVVLERFYAGTSSATALVQKGGKQQPEAPEIFDAPYQGMQSESGGQNIWVVEQKNSNTSIVRGVIFFS